jgi:uncharacterized protein (TIGR00299 family) protein
LPTIAYFDCFSGASGDMLLGALVDAGLSLEDLRAELAKLRLPAGAFDVTATTVLRAGFRATKVDVSVREPPRHRSLADVLAIIEGSALPTGDQERAAAVFRRLAEAEARVHGVAVAQVELHEVGAVDAIVDIAGAVAGLRLLGVEFVFCSPLPLGSGATEGRHGALPVPAPATLELVAMAGAPAAEGLGAGELVTPTGAALLTTLARFERPALRLERTGYGAGARDPAGRPNVLRVWLGRAATASRPMRLVETNIDDMSAELLANAQEALFQRGAADVWFTPVQMKKNRPGVMLSALCPEGLEPVIVETMLRETTTLGVRSREVTRFEAERGVFEFESSLGPAAVKVKRLPGEPPRVSPEFEVCRLIAAERGLTLAEVYDIVAREAEAALRENR